MTALYSLILMGCLVCILHPASCILYVSPARSKRPHATTLSFFRHSTFFLLRIELQPSLMQVKSRMYLLEGLESVFRTYRIVAGDVLCFGRQEVSRQA